VPVLVMESLFAKTSYGKPLSGPIDIPDAHDEGVLAFV